ncbi:MAG TPA: tetratricopeptide repeat protein [Terriglobales bacterium]|nr:tetratricopeptide repeat protein [Terriglobales bacterium]
MSLRRTARSYLRFLAAGLCLFALRGFAQPGSDFERGMAEFRAGHYGPASVLFAKAEAASPGTTDALLYQAKALVHLQNFADAERALCSYVASHANSSDAYYMLGYVLNRENQPADSLAAYTKAAAITLPASDDLKIVGLDYVLLNDYPDAIKWLREAVRLDGNNKDAWYFLGRSYYTEARLSEAREAFLGILKLDPHDARAENNLGLIFESSGEPAAAIDAYRQAIAWQEQSPHPSEQPYVNLGNILMEQGRSAEAREPLEKAVALAPDNAFCRLALGVYYHKMGQLMLARRELERATQLDPQNAIAHYQLGRLYADIHATDLAKAEFQRTAELKSRAAGSKPAGTNP